MILTLLQNQDMIGRIGDHNQVDKDIVVLKYRCDKYTMSKNLCSLHQNRQLFYDTIEKKELFQQC
jgi:hypothetical protein